MPLAACLLRSRNKMSRRFRESIKGDEVTDLVARSLRVLSVFRIGARVFGCDAGDDDLVYRPRLDCEILRAGDDGIADAEAAAIDVLVVQLERLIRTLQA